MNRVLSYLSSLLLVVVLGCAAAWAQTSTAQINGTVKDQSGAVLPGAEITATQIATGGKRTTVTNETGSYTLTNLPIGPYMVEVSLPGFRTYAQSGIVLQVNDNPWANYAGGNPFPLPVNSSVPFNTFASYETLPFNARSAYAQQWNLSVQKQIGTDWLASANYVGSETVHMWTGNQTNPGIFMGLGSCTINGQTSNPCSTTANVDRRRKL